MAAILDKKTEEKKKSSAKSAKADNAAKKSMKELYEGSAPNVKAGGGEKAGAKKSNIAYRVLVKPLVTEKATVSGAQNKYTFEVAKESNKVEVAKAIKEVYGITPTQVNIVKIQGKRVNFGRRAGRRKDLKKAIITLPKGKSINVYEGV